jgi:hypothetical protein
MFTKVFDEDDHYFGVDEQELFDILETTFKCSINAYQANNSAGNPFDSLFNELKEEIVDYLENGFYDNESMDQYYAEVLSEKIEEAKNYGGEPDYEGLESEVIEIQSNDFYEDYLGIDDVYRVIIDFLIYKKIACKVCSEYVDFFEFVECLEDSTCHYYKDEEDYVVLNSSQLAWGALV